MKPHDALQTELEGISSGSADELRDVLALAEGLRAAASQIGTPPGLQARRGAILTAATAGAAPAAGRRIPRILAMAGTLVAGAALGWFAAFATSGGLDRFGGPAPGANPTPVETPDKRPLESASPRPTPSESPEASPSDEPSPSPAATGIDKPDETPEPAETPEPGETLEPGETPDIDEDNSGSGSDSSGSGSDGDSSGSGSGVDDDSSGSGSGDDSP